MKLYNDYNSYLKNKYGCKVYKIGIDAGFSCPNRDGTKGSEGCIYCNHEGSRSSYTNPKDTIEKQICDRIRYLKDAKSATKFIAYFQTFTNTHAPLGTLKTTYDNILLFNEIVGLSIGTRPDSVDTAKVDLISSYNRTHEVWIEYGIQSIHDKTLDYLMRGHSFNEFLAAVTLAKGSGIRVCAHVILGLPGESKADMIETARVMTALKIDGIKIHLLHILKGSYLEKLYNNGKIPLLDQDEYAELASDFLENLSPEIIIQRLTGEGTRSSHIAPIWALDKIGTINRIGDTLKRRGSCQGSKCASH